MKLRLLLMIIFLTSVSMAQDAEEYARPQIPYNPEEYICYRTVDNITVDGKMDEQSWQKAPWSNDYQDIEGDLKPKPYHRTRMKMLWDDTYFYFLVEMEEPHVWAKLTQRDTVIFYDNDWEIFLDPDGDTHEYYEYEVNAFGTEWDLFLTKPYRDQWGSALNAFEFIGLKTGVDVQGTVNNPNDVDKSWRVEVAIPWKSMKDCAHMPLPPEDGDQWRANFSRVQWKTEVVNGHYKKSIDPTTGKNFREHNWSWSPQGLINMHYPEVWGFVQFSTHPAGGETAQWIPDPNDPVKMALRKLYYNLRTYQLQKNTFTDDLDALGMADVTVDGFAWPPHIEFNTTQFHAWIADGAGQKTWHITHDSKVWMEDGTETD